MSDIKYIEVKGVNFINKGAELMLLAIKQQISSRYPSAIICLNLRSGSVKKIRQKGFYCTPHFFSKKYGFINTILNLLTFLIPQKVMKWFGFVKVSRIQVILDASGFTYSDQWGYEAMEVMSAYYAKMRLKGVKVIFLPQAFGPFEKPRSKKYATRLLNESDLVFARDEISLQYVQSVALPSGLQDKPFPDFTNLLSVQASQSNDFHGKVCIIPNYRMIDKGVGTSYIQFLKQAILQLEHLDKPYFFLIHETDKDLIILKKLEEELRKEITYIFSDDALEIKTIIGQCELIIGSRFHGLISSLSQGIPVIITGWSHKYEELANDYGIINFLAKDLEDTALPKQLISEVFETYDEVTKKISKNALRIKGRANDLWEIVHKTIT